MRFEIAVSRMVEEVAIYEVDADSKEEMADKLLREEFVPPEDKWERFSCHDSGEVTHVDGKDVEYFIREALH